MALSSFTWFGPWGLLPLAFVGSADVASCLGRVAFRGSPWRYQVMGGLALSLALFTGGLQLLSHAGWVRPSVISSCLFALVLGARWLARHSQPLFVRGLFRGFRPEPSTRPLLFLAACALWLAALAAYWLPIWQWDSLGYHLPFVNFVLQSGGLDGLPRDVAYLSTYPRNVELLFVGLRAFLPDDRLVDLAQIPFGLIGSAAIGAIARELGARPVDALCAGASWLLVPAVFLQLPTDYIDVATGAYFLLSAFFLVAHPTRSTLLCAGLSIGLFLGTKPSAPPQAAVLIALLLVRGYRAKDLRSAAIGSVLAGALGSEAYLLNVIRHGNPVWPAIVDMGPLHLPGTISVTELLSSGAGAEKVHGTLLHRVVKSWSALNSLPVFDMRVGGLSLLFWLLLAPAGYLVAKRRLFWFVALVFVAVLTPDPAVARYVLALPGLVFAAGAASLVLAPAGLRTAAHALLAVVGAANLAYAAPGLAGEGPPLTDYFQMSWAERERAVGANGSPAEFVDARNRLSPGEVAVYDRSLWLPYLMWRSDLSNRVVRVPDDASVDSAERVLATPGVRLVAAGNEAPLAGAVSREPHRYDLLFRCKEPCVVYWQH